MVKKIVEACAGSVKEKIICVLGVTFKPNTDDMRDSPSLTIIPRLIKLKSRIRVFDPKGEKEGKELLSGVEWKEDPYSAAEGSDLIILLTEWNEFRALDLKKLASVMRDPRMVDLRNIYSKNELIDAGFKKYVGLGR